MHTSAATQGGETISNPARPRPLTAGQLAAIPTPAGRYRALTQQRDAEMAEARAREARYTLLAAKQLLGMLKDGLSQVQIRAELLAHGILISDSRISELIKLARESTQGGN